MHPPHDLGYAPLAGDATDPAPFLAGAALSSSPAAWGAVAADVDGFLTRVYRYYLEGGAAALVAARALNLAALAFTAAFAGVAALVVQWSNLSLPCVRRAECDVAAVALDWHPFSRGLTARTLAGGLTLAAFAAYWCVAAAHAAADARGAAGVAATLAARVGLSDATLAAAPWSAVAARLVAAQHATPLLPDGTVLDEAAIAARILRKDNYLTALVAAGALPLAAPLPWLRSRPALTASLEWNVRALVLDAAFPGGGTSLSRAFASDPATLAARCRRAALVNAAAAPFAAVFLAVLFFMRHAERFYHHPSTAGARAWSRAAAVRLRDFNELPHYVAARLADAQPAADRYLASFPSPLAATVARFCGFVAGSIAALLLAAAAVESRVLEAPLAGRTVVWWVAALGIVLAACRAAAGDSGDGGSGAGGGPHAAAARRPDPNLALLSLAAATHHLPRHWRGRGHTREVAAEVGGLYRYRAALFLDEALSVVATPAILYWALPAAAADICAFFRDNTVRVPGVGDACSWSVFGGGGEQGADPRPLHTAAAKPSFGGPARSRHGKLAASLVTFAAAYPSWQPDADARRLLAAVEARAAAAAATTATGSTSLLRGGGGGWCGAGSGWRGGAFGSADVVGPSSAAAVAAAAAASTAPAWPAPADPAAAAACHLALLAMEGDEEDGGESASGLPTADRRPSTAHADAWRPPPPLASRPSPEAELATLAPGAGAAPAATAPPPPRSALAAELAAATAATAAAASPSPPPAAFDDAGAWWAGDAGGGGSGGGGDSDGGGDLLGDPLADPGLGAGGGGDPWAEDGG